MNVPSNCEPVELAEKDHFVYNEELLSLQEMASCQVALALWNGYSSRCSANKWKIDSYSRSKFIEVFGLYSTYREDTDALVESLKTPRSIETILKTSLENVRKEMEQCVHCFFSEIYYCHYPKGSRISTIKQHWCAWRPNGKIDYLKTAEMMVSSENNDFDLKMKFVIMCEFYMEEKLKTFPLDSLPADFIKQLLWINEVHSTRYWIKYLSGDRSEEINAYKMVAECILTDGMGSIRINHFWHRLSDDDQVKAVYNMLVKRSSIYCEKWQAIEPLIGSMSWDQQSRLLAMPRAGETIISFSCLYSSSSKCAVWAWKHCRDVVTGKEFYTMISEIPSFGGKIVLSSIKVELWEIAYDHHRNFLVTENQYFEDLLYRNIYSKKNISYTPSTYILLNKSLALKSMNERKTLIMKFAIALATGTQDPRYIQEILDLNLPHPNDQIEFKKSVTDSEEMIWHCAKLWMNGNFDVLNARVEYYYNGDLNSIREYNQKLLSEVTSSNWARSADKSAITDIDKWHKCCKFIDEILPDDPAKAMSAKQQLVSRFLEYQTLSYCFYKHFGLAVKTVESVFPNKVELNRIKTEFIKAKYLLNGEFWMVKELCADLYFHCMIEWCCDHNEEAVAELKNKIPNHDTIFDIVFFQLNKVYVTETAGLKISLLTCLDKYLSWYLASEDEIMDYKMRRLNESDKSTIFTTLFQQRDDQSLKMLLEWFFDGDEAKVREFRSKKIKF